MSTEGSSLVEVEVWPEYGSGPLWFAGAPVDVTELPPVTSPTG